MCFLPDGADWQQHRQRHGIYPDVLKDLAAKINSLPSLQIPQSVGKIPMSFSSNTNSIRTDLSAFAMPPPMAAQQPMSLPSFNGTKPLTWLARAIQYFAVHQTPVPQSIPLALIAFSGPKLAWIQLLLQRDSTLSWDTFSKELLARFDAKNIAEIQVEFSTKCDRQSAAFDSPLCVKSYPHRCVPTYIHTYARYPNPTAACSPVLDLSAPAAVPTFGQPNPIQTAVVLCPTPAASPCYGSGCCS